MSPVKLWLGLLALGLCGGFYFARGFTCVNTGAGLVTANSKLQVVETVPEAFVGQQSVDQGRTLSQPGIWLEGPSSSYSLALDRQAARLTSLEQRVERRAFDGAPPVMPHSTNFGSGNHTCLDCHAGGMRMGDRVAHPLSHVALSACLQCHVEASHNQLAPTPVVPNSFEGQHPATTQVRATTHGRPPTIPHSTTMRTQCLSCHGQHGYEGLRTSHPKRGVCMQCHVPATGNF